MVCRIAKVMEKDQSSNDNLFGVRNRNTTWAVRSKGHCAMCVLLFPLSFEEKTFCSTAHPVQGDLQLPYRKKV